MERTSIQKKGRPSRVCARRRSANLRRGVTLLELLAVLAIVAVLSGLAIGGFTSFQRRHALSGSAEIVVSALAQARALSLGGKNGVAWGVHFASTTVTLFEAPLFDPEDPENVPFALERGVMVSALSLGGGSEVVFARLSGKPVQSGTTTLSLVSDTDQQMHVVVDESGSVRTVQ